MMRTIVAGLSALSFAALSAQPPTPIATSDVLWRVDVKVLPANTFGHHRVEFSPDGSLIGVVYQPAEARLLRASDGALVRQLTAPSPRRESAYSIALSSSGRVAIGRLAGVEVLDIMTGRSERTFGCGNCERTIGALQFSPDGSMLAFQGTAGPMNPNPPLTFVVDVDANVELAAFDVFSNRAAVSFSPDGRRLAASAFSSNGSALGFSVWNIGDRQLLNAYPGEARANFGEMGTGVVDGRWIVAHGRAETIEMRSLDDNRVIWTVPLLPSNSELPRVLGTELDEVEVAPNGEFLVTYESPVATDPNSHVAGAIVLRDTVDGSVTAVYTVHGVSDISIAPDSRSFVYATGAGSVHIARVRVADSLRRLFEAEQPLP
jgi:WD40 repeat protein